MWRDSIGQFESFPEPSRLPEPSRAHHDRLTCSVPFILTTCYHAVGQEASCSSFVTHVACRVDALVMRQLKID